MRERLFATLDRETRDRAPCVSPGQTAIADLQRAVGAEWPKAHEDAGLMAKLALASVTLGKQEGVRIPFETTMDASAFGTEVEMGTPLRHPYVSKHPLADQETVDQTVVPDPSKDGRGPIVLEALRQLRCKEAPVLCGVAAPFTLACFLRGERDVMTDLIINPSFIKKVLSLAEEWGTAFIQDAVKAGADVIVLEDTWASGDILSQKQYQDFALPGEQKLARTVHEVGARSILQQCGCPKSNLELMAESGADGITLHQEVDVAEAKRILSNRFATIGNLDPRTLAIIDPRDVRALSSHCLEQGVDVLAPACGLDPATPLANLKAIAEVAQRFRR